MEDQIEKEKLGFEVNLLGEGIFKKKRKHYSISNWCIYRICSLVQVRIPRRSRTENSWSLWENKSMAFAEEKECLQSWSSVIIFWRPMWGDGKKLHQDKRVIQ